jgi:hypothetical protein
MIEPTSRNKGGHLSTSSTIGDVLSHPAFAGFGSLILPWDNRSYDESMPLSDIGLLLLYHSHVDPRAVVSALNRMIDDVNSGQAVFYDIYTETEKRENTTLKNTGLFFVRGRTGAPFAMIAPGGGFSYVGSVHEGFPYAQEISKAGYECLRPEISRGPWCDSAHPGYGSCHLLHIPKSQYAWRQSTGLLAVGQFGRRADGGGDRFAGRREFRRRRPA